MVRRSEHAPLDPAAPGGRAERPFLELAPDDEDIAAPPDLSGLPVAGLTRRRLLMIASFLAVAWLAFAFIRQVGDVTAASARADALAAANQQLRSEIAALDSELRLIQRQQYIVQQARGYRLGSPQEIPFTLQPPFAELAPDAPGSAGVRVGAVVDHRTPLEAWLQLLFGPVS